MTLQGILYVPNGPMLIDPAREKEDLSRAALRERGKRFPRDIHAVFVVTPHFSTKGGIAVIHTEKMKQIFDFYGFPEEFYEVKYEPPGNPELAEELVSMGQKHGIPIVGTDQWGLDHGAWTPLVSLFPDAKVPVVPVSVMSDADPVLYEKLGETISGMASEKNIVLISTGSLIHRLDLFQANSQEIPHDAGEYLKNVLAALENSDWNGLWNIPGKYYGAAAPEGGLAPLRTLAGAVGGKFNVDVLSNEILYNSVSMTTLDFRKK